MKKTKFLKYVTLILLITISINLLFFPFLPNKVNLVFLIKSDGTIRSNVDKVIGVLIFPLLIIFTFITGYTFKRYTIIFVLVMIFLIIDFFIMTINLVG